jgi:hypothetical protein
LCAWPSKDPAADRKALATLYAEALMNLHPWQLWPPDGQPAENTLELRAVLEGVLRRNPDHPGADLMQGR